MLTRRTLLQGSAAVLGLGATGTRLVAEAKIGTGMLRTVSDGNLVLPGDFMFGGLPEAELGPILTATGVDPKVVEPECNVTLWQDGDRTVLFDVGAGSSFMPSAGDLPDNLDVLGIAPEDVTHVIFTHAHPDHLWGLLDDFDDPRFPNAEMMMGRAEWDYWWNPETVDTIAPDRQAFAVGAKRRLEVVEDQMGFFDDGEEVLPGLAAVLTPGHTPGHMSFELRQGGDAAMILGDAVGNHHVAFSRPGWAVNSDQDGDLGAQTRVALMDRIASEQMRIVGFHLPQGGIGRAEKTADGYRFVPDGA
ncbi:MBL fold metallo-hydrolase [Pseudooceanicola sp. C21-150M6]|uniref:MBL fold metallo-hydrolase n=1 Tax=Pseudooceanicola sp. C21-150M6 TaxID=3434355 RepID=UPI003D7F1FD7